MKCPKCTNYDTKVIDSRPVEESAAIRRRRECESCKFRFSTYEEIEILDLSVIKRDGSRQPYAREKLERGLYRAFEKRPHDSSIYKQIIATIEQELQKKSQNSEVSSQEIGEIVMRVIRKIDKVAYIRFASVYRQFDDIEEFKLALQKL